VKTIHMFGMGFTQTLAQNSGQISLWLKARKFGTFEDCILTPMSWRTDPKEVANFLYLLSNQNTRIYGYFYSWGAGWFFRRLVEEMDKLKLRFHTIVLCDPVKRSGVFPDWLPMNPTSLLTYPVMSIPKNVSRVYVFNQNVNRPKGHDVVIENPAFTWIESEVTLHVRHEDMEDQLEYHDCVLSIIEESVNEKVDDNVRRTALLERVHKLSGEETGRDGTVDSFDAGISAGNPDRVPESGRDGPQDRVWGGPERRSGDGGPALETPESGK
jgi:hypothetical protein